MNQIIIGNRGTGKSTLAIHEARQLNSRIIAYDPSDQFVAADYVFTDPGDLESFMRDDDIWQEGKFLVSYRPQMDQEEEFDQFAAVLWKYSGRQEGAASYVLLIDESDELQKPLAINLWLNRFIRRSQRREKGNPNPVDVIQTTHNPQDLNRISFGQSDKIFLFWTWDRRALDAIAKQFGEEVAEQVSDLSHPPYRREYLEVDMLGGVVQVHDEPTGWYEKIEKEPKTADFMGT